MTAPHSARGAIAALNGMVARRLDTQVSALGLGVFRVAYGCVLFLEVAQLFYFRHFFFDPVPYLSPSATGLTVALAAWLVVVGCLIVGLFTRPAAIANYVFTVVSLSRFTTFEYHHDCIMIGVNFLLMCLPVGRRLSLDRLIAARRTAPSELRDTASVLAYEVPLFLCVALVYFDSALYKLFSPMWAAGLGVWQPASFPYATLVDWSWLLDHQLLVKAMGYLVMGFELLFIVLMWFRRARVPLLVVGIGFHLGIFFVLALPLFALGMASLYLLLVPPDWWERIAVRLGASATTAPAAIVQRASPWRAALVSGFLALATASQLLLLLESPPLARRSEAIRDTRLYKRWAGVTRALMGIQTHPIFMDSRYGHYRRQFAVVYVDEQRRQHWLPVVTPEGHASWYSTGRQQVYWMHRVNGSELRPERMEDGVRRLTAFWAHQHDVDLRHASFLIFTRDLKQAHGWEPGLAREQIQRGWDSGGAAHWSDGVFTLDLQVP